MGHSRAPMMAISPSAELLAGVAALLVPLGMAPSLAQGLPLNQPLAIEEKPGLPPPPCALVVPRSEALLQPLRISPVQVTQKNSMGCLSAADALYGPDGCPRQVCGKRYGDRVPMPQLGGS